MSKLRFRTNAVHRSQVVVHRDPEVYAQTVARQDAATQEASGRARKSLQCVKTGQTCTMYMCSEILVNGCKQRSHHAAWRLRWSKCCSVCARIADSAVTEGPWRLSTVKTYRLAPHHPDSSLCPPCTSSASMRPLLFWLAFLSALLFSIATRADATLIGRTVGARLCRT
jgi:hypothetical protein